MPYFEGISGRNRFSNAYSGLNPGLGVWMACLAESDACIGWACLKDLDGSEHIEVGYRLAKSYWGNGYATELCKALLRYGFDELKISTICAVARPDNVASRRVLEKCGLKDQGMAIYYNTEVIFYDIHNQDSIFHN